MRTCAGQVKPPATAGQWARQSNAGNPIIFAKNTRSNRAAHLVAGESPFADGDALILLDCLTSCSVIAAATGFEPDDEPPCRAEPEPADIDDIDGGGKDGSSFADSLTSAAVSAVSDFVAEGAAAA